VTRLLTSAAAVLAVAALAGTVGGDAGARPSVCPKPSGLTFVRKTGAAAGVLRWRAGRLPAGAAGYRVYRDREVVGQTRNRTFPVRVTPGRRVRLTVRVALRSGATVPCRATIVRRLRWTPPTSPRNITILEQDDGVRVTWSRSKRGEGRLVGYRVFRNRAAIRQVKGLSVVVPVPPLRAATFEVGAVDSRGRVSKLSAPARVVRGHRAPTAPETVEARTASDRVIDLTWAPGRGNGGVRLSYQVRRNGRLIAQTAATQLRVGNLFPSTRYSFTITTVDSLGYRSAETLPVEATTALPQQSSGRTFAFVLASTSRSFLALQNRYTHIGTVVPTYFDCDPDGRFTGKDDPLITGWARLRGIRVHARWNCQRTATLTLILRDPAVRAAAIDGIVGGVLRNGYDGANIDFEAGRAADRDAYTAFVRDLAARLHAEGKQISIDVSAKFKDVQNHPRSTFYDYDELSPHADTILVMAWGIHWSTSAPGSIDELPWVTKVADYVAARPRRDRFVIGFGLYGFDWPNNGGSASPGTPFEYEDITGLAARVSATPSVDPIAQAPMFRYVDAGGTPHEVWYVDAASLSLRLEVARSRGLNVGLWRLGREDPAIWALPALRP
jgi:spore germination protein YaaH